MVNFKKLVFLRWKKAEAPWIEYVNTSTLLYGEGHIDEGLLIHTKKLIFEKDTQFIASKSQVYEID